MAFYLRTNDTTQWVLERNGIVYATGRSTHPARAQREYDIVRNGGAPPAPEWTQDGWVLVFRDKAGNELGRWRTAHPSPRDCAKEAITALRPEASIGPSFDGCTRTEVVQDVA